MNIKKNWFLKIKKPYLLAIPSAIITALSSYSVSQNLKIVNGKEANNLARLSLVSLSGNVHGHSNYEKKKILEEDGERLLQYYRSHDHRHINVNYENNNLSDSNVNLFVHFRGQVNEENSNNLWLENIRLNQLSIDRYGYEYDDSGNKKADSSASLHSIVKWSDIDLENIYKPDEYKLFPSFSFRFFNSSIPKQEVEILSYDKEDKYKLEESEMDVSKDWFVWMDKDLLSIKLNYALQTYVFNQPGAQNEVAIKTILGEDGSKSNDNQKLRKASAKKNYDALKEEYKTFAKDYIQTFIDTSATDTTANWSSVVNYVINKDSFIKSQDLNKIYNRFKKQKKGLELFKPHLITKITSGATGNWKISLKLEKSSDKDNSEAKEYEAREIVKRDSLNNEETDDEKKKNSISLFSDPDTNKEVNINEIVNLITKYSVRYFEIPKNIEYISSSYTADNSVGKEILNVLSFQHDNEFGIYVNQQWIPFIMIAVFFAGILFYLIVKFKSPGAIMGVSAIANTVNVAGAFFALGSQLSLMGAFAFFVGILYSLFLVYYLLSFLKKIFSIEFLDSSNVWSVFKRGLVLITDISLPSFIFSSFLVFFAPEKFREFGIISSMFVLFSYVFVSILGCLMALNRACGNIDNLSYVFNSQSDSEDIYSLLCDKFFSKKMCLISTSSFFPLVVISAVIVFCIIGFNSFSLLKENFLVIGSKDLFSKISGKEISSFDHSHVYLTKEIPSNLSESNLKIMSTKAFGDFFTVSNLFSSVFFSHVLISFYSFVRFKFKGILVFFTNTLLSFLLFVSFVVLSRIPVSSSIFLVFCSFLSLSIVYNMMFLSLDSQNKVSWYFPLIFDIKNRIYHQIKWSIAWCCGILAVTCITHFWIIALYFGAAIICVHALSIFSYKFLDTLISKFSNKYLLKYNFSSMEGNANYQLDPSEEEIIEGINN